MGKRIRDYCRGFLKDESGMEFPQTAVIYTVAWLVSTVAVVLYYKSVNG